MKNIKKFALCFVLMIAVLAACNQKKPKELIIKKWQVTDAKSSGTKQVSEEELKGMKMMVFEFTADGNLNVSGTPGGASAGKYTVSDDGKTLTTTGPQGQVTTNEILTLNDSKLVIKDNNSGLTITTESK